MMQTSFPNPLELLKSNKFNLIRWWKGHGGEWLIACKRNDMVEEVYRTSGNPNSVPSKNWKEVNGKGVGDLSVSTVDTSIRTLLGKENISKNLFNNLR